MTLFPHITPLGALFGRVITCMCVCNYTHPTPFLDWLSVTRRVESRGDPSGSWPYGDVGAAVIISWTPPTLRDEGENDEGLGKRSNKYLSTWTYFKYSSSVKPFRVHVGPALKDLTPVINKILTIRKATRFFKNNYEQAESVTQLLDGLGLESLRTQMFGLAWKGLIRFVSSWSVKQFLPP
jgi:hypothetical protein